MKQIYVGLLIRNKAGSFSKSCISISLIHSFILVYIVDTFLIFALLSFLRLLLLLWGFSCLRLFFLFCRFLLFDLRFFTFWCCCTNTMIQIARVEGTKVKDKANGKEVICKTGRGTKVTVPKDELYMFTCVFLQKYGNFVIIFCASSIELTFIPFRPRQAIVSYQSCTNFVRSQGTIQKNQIYTWVGVAKSVLIR